MGHLGPLGIHAALGVTCYVMGVSGIGLVSEITRECLCAGVGV